MEKDNDEKIVLSQMKYLYQQAPKLKNVQNVKFMSSKEISTGFSIGKRQGKINEHNYIERFQEYMKYETYTIVLTDNSIINMHYEFDMNKKMNYHSLSYVPYIESDDDTNKFKYIRIDFEVQGREEFVHSLVHLHQTPIREGYRIPLSHKVYPCEFVYFVLKYIYNEDNMLLEQFPFYLKKEEMLTSNEVKRLYISFGNKDVFNK